MELKLILSGERIKDQESKKTIKMNEGKGPYMYVRILGSESNTTKPADFPSEAKEAKWTESRSLVSSPTTTCFLASPPSE